MFKYQLSLKPVVQNGGVEGLEPARQLLFRGVLSFVAKLIESAEDVDDVQITSDNKLIITAKSDVSEALKRLGGNAIVEKL
jgi:hypothetical protein